MRVNIDLVKQKVMDYDLDEALKLLSDSLGNTEYEDQVILLNQRLHRANKEKNAAIITDSDFETEMNKITLSISALLQTLKSDFVVKEMVFDPKIHFCTSQFETLPEYKDRVYAESFVNQQTCAIGWELRSRFPAVKFPVSLGIKWRFQKPDTGFSAEYSGELKIAEGWSSHWFSRTWGYKEPNKWTTGTYFLEVTIDDDATVKSSFTIV